MLKVERRRTYLVVKLVCVEPIVALCTEEAEEVKVADDLVTEDALVVDAVCEFVKLNLPLYVYVHSLAPIWQICMK